MTTEPTETFPRPPSVKGIAWEFTGQAVATMQFVDALYGESEFATKIVDFRSEIRRAQTLAPYGDGLGLVAATLDGENETATPFTPTNQGLTTPFQAISERVGLAATNWAIYADQGFNLFIVPPLPRVTLSVAPASLAEAAGTATVTATLSAVSELDVTVVLEFIGTATSSSDYSRSATQIVIPAGNTTGTVTLTAVQDTLDETNESIVVGIIGVTNGTKSGVQQVTTIIIDDVPNELPSISDILDKTIKQSTATGLINFMIGDAETAPANLAIAGSSSNKSLVPDGNIVFGGSSEVRTVVVTPIKHRSGAATITVTVSDGTASVSDTFKLTVTANPSTWQNPIMPLSVDGDLVIAPIDALLIINELNVSTVRATDGRLPDVPPEAYTPPWFDTNGDFFASPLDVLLVINDLNEPRMGEGEFREVLFITPQLTSVPSTNSIIIEAGSSSRESISGSTIASNSAQQCRIQESRRLAVTKSKRGSVSLEEILDEIAEDTARYW